MADLKEIIETSDQNIESGSKTLGVSRKKVINGIAALIAGGILFCIFVLYKIFH